MGSAEVVPLGALVFGALAFGSLALGCGSGEDAPVEPAGCKPGEWIRDGVCVAAGLPPDLDCPPGEWLLEGACIPAGVPPDGCGEGFEHDGDRGCEPTLPSMPCPPSQMAVPGETRCRDVSPCAAGTWGDIPVEADTEYVDASYVGMDSDGSALKPWRSIQEGVNAAAPGAIVAIAEGSYLEDLVINGTSVRVWGVCPARVEVVGTGAEPAALLLLANTSGTTVRGLGIRGNAAGVFASGSLDVALEQVWIHDNAGRGVAVQNNLGETGIRLTGVLVESTVEVGVYVSGSDARVESSVVRATKADPRSTFGRGVSAQAHAASGAPATLVVRGSLVEQNRDDGVFVMGSEVTVEGSVVRTTQLDGQGLFGRGVTAVTAADAGAPSTLLVVTSLVEDNHDVGVFVSGSTATVESTVVRATQPDAQGFFGRGIGAESQSVTLAESTLLLRTSLVDANAELGVYVAGSEATIEASVVRNTELDGEGRAGRGLNVQAHPTTQLPSTLVMQSSLVEQNHEFGLFIAGSHATVDASVVRATLRNALELRGRGVHVQPDAATGALASLLLTSSIVEQSHEAGVVILGSEATIETSVVRDTLADAAGSYGEGIVVLSPPGKANATITGARIDKSARAAVAVWGGTVVLEGSALTCQAFDVNYETYQGIAAALDDRGGNACGCPEATGECVAVTASLAPPPAVD
jgi:hypothetical protein